tara:strand:+ start:1968 stop:2414 length:447 start_codon:yes stop_codon:yes gene_type:complete
VGYNILANNKLPKEAIMASAKAIKVFLFTSTGEDSFTASGSCDNKAFVAKTILWQGAPIFKVQEADSEGEVKYLKMSDSNFNRGERIAIARHLKMVRLGERALDEKLTAAEFATKSVKELRAQCKERGLTGYFVKGIKKADLIAKLAA